MIKVFYFSRLREAVGQGSEDLELGGGISDVSSLVVSLRARGGAWTTALAPDRPVLVAVNQSMAGLGTLLADGDEVAFFPPVTGG